MLQYHHCSDFNNITFGEIKAKPSYSDPDFKSAYLWLEKEIGFYPLFVAVGITEDAIRITGYDAQWARVISSKIVGRKKSRTYVQRNVLRRKGEFPNYVLFSFRELEGVFMDYDYWHLVLHAGYKNYQMTDYEKRLIFKPSYSELKWLGKARYKPVQLVTQKLYLPNAERIWTRNNKTKKSLESMGFENVEVRRIFL